MRPSERRVLGYHSKPGDRSVLEYSRDELAAPLRSLMKVVDAVAVGDFLPDASRSGRWKHEARA
eukprot:14261429-Alexandrium_andersonii.AAC.1